MINHRKPVFHQEHCRQKAAYLSFSKPLDEGLPPTVSLLRRSLNRDKSGGRNTL